MLGTTPPEAGNSNVCLTTHQWFRLGLYTDIMNNNDNIMIMI